MVFPGGHRISRDIFQLERDIAQVYLLMKKSVYPKIHTEIQRTQNSQNKLEKEQTHTSQFQNLLQNHNYQNSVLLT